jgi:hypothetical protein
VRFSRLAVGIFGACLACGSFAFAQEGQQSPPATTAAVPRLIRITGSVRDVAGQPLTGSIGITFTLYKGQNDAVAVWNEIQTVKLDPAGRYSVLLGATNEAGLPQEIFSAGEARWLGVRPDGQPEQPRVLFLSVAYALKAADTDMLGGRPASAFVLAGSPDAPTQPASAAPAGAANLRTGSPSAAAHSIANPFLMSAATCPAITSDGTATANRVAKFTTACNIQNSAIFESGGNVGIGNTSPAGVLDVTGTAFIRGSLSALGGANMLPVSAATASQGSNSTPLDLTASVFNSTLLAPVNYVFRWQSEPSGNNTTNTAATLNLLFGVTGSVSETGLSVARNGIVTFAPGQTFPGLGTVTSVATGTGLTGGPITKSGTISIPTGGVTNALLANSSVTVKAGSGLSGGGTVALGGTITLTNVAPSSGGTVTSVDSGTGLTGGPITTTGTLSLNTGFTDARYLQLSGGTLTGALTGTTATLTGGLKASTGTFTGALSAVGATMPGKGTATATQGFNSNPLDFVASSFNSSKATAVAQDFRWQSEASGNNSANPSATMNLLFGSNGAAPAETGLSVASNGRLTFAAGQTFPGTSTITQITAGTGLAGGGTTGNVTLSLLTTCSTGQILQWNGTIWVCGNLGGLSGATDGIAYFASPTSLTSTAAPTNGQILMGATGGAPVLGTLTAGPNVTITNGAGSVKISANGQPVLAYFATGGASTGASQGAGQNVTALFGFLLPYNVTSSKITYDVTTADNTANAYDIGLFNNAGKLIVDLGAAAGTTFAPAAGFRTLSWTQGSTNLPPGRYYLGFTTNCSSSCAAIGAATTYVSFAVNTSAGASTGGALPSTMTPPADVWDTGNQPTIVIH